MKLVDIFNDEKGLVSAREENIMFGWKKWHWVFKFANGYGASVVSGYGIYCDEDHPFELAVLKKIGKGMLYDLDYDNSVSQGDVRGYLTADEVRTFLTEIRGFHNEMD